MSSGFFGVLQQDDSSDDDASSFDDADQRDTPTHAALQQAAPASTAAHIPAYEDLSTSRADEETVLEAVYGDEFKRSQGVWGTSRLQVQVRPPDVDREHIGSQLL